MVIQMNGAVSIINLLSLAEINDPIEIGKSGRIFFKPKTKAKDIIKALFESASEPEGFLVLPQDRIIAFEP